MSSLNLLNKNKGVTNSVSKYGGILFTPIQYTVEVR